MAVSIRHEKSERIGRMNERVQVHFATTTVNTYGERVQAWEALGTYWAEVKYFPLRSKEGEAAGQETVMQAVQFVMRSNSTIGEAMRAYWNSRLYDIESLSLDETKQYLTLTCKQYGQDASAPPEGEYSVGQLAYTETFTGLLTADIVVTVYGGNLPTNAAQIFVFMNGQFISQWSHVNDTITLEFTPDPEDVFVVTFFA